MRLLIASLLMGVSAMAAARPAPPPPVAATPQIPFATLAALPNSGAVRQFYATRGNPLIWFRYGPRSAAATRLMSILQRAPIDGLRTGPQLAVRVQEAVRLAQTGNPEAIRYADQLLSTAWVSYIQALRAQPKEIEFADAAVTPQTGVAAILGAAASAPSLERHLTATSDVNPIYAQLRAAASSLALVTGGVLDRRTTKNLDRARILPSSGRYILVNVANQQLFMFEDGYIRDSMKVIVGKPDHRTPLIASTIHYATFNPYWNPPQDLIREKIAPAVVREGASYLNDRDYEVVAGWQSGAPVIAPDRVNWAAVAAGAERIRLRKKPGSLNPMGQMKFSFENEGDIYLHDTPEKPLFNNAQRTLSLGCIRLEDAPRLARWLLQSEPVAPSTKPETHVQLAHGVPVYLTYLTAQVNGSQLSFAPDVYGLDDGDDVGLASIR